MTNEIKFTPEMLEQAAKVPSAAALQALAQENGTPMTAEQAATYYAQLHPETGAISDEELDNVSGGCAGSTPPEKCKFCGHTAFTKSWSGLNTFWFCDKCHLAD